MTINLLLFHKTKQKWGECTKVHVANHKIHEIANKLTGLQCSCVYRITAATLSYTVNSSNRYSVFIIRM